ncbi:uncharacterized protein LOC135143346 [Zophobas morio]|uniref:uncharacterized protein LOC135143346 n=1 Tax=Zophobas morio TaxID=2755281 RepID=UPI003082DE59
MSSSESESEIIESAEKSNKQEQFVSLLKKWPILLSKSQTPAKRVQKKEALKEFSNAYLNNCGEQLTNEKILKKINNMKTELKKKSDMNRTGNEKNVLKSWEETLLKLINGTNEKNPTIYRIPGAAAAGTSKEVEAVELNSAHITTLPLPPKRKCTSTELAAETDETRVLSLSELQRLVLLEQLKLIKMQQKEIENKRERE